LGVGARATTGDKLAVLNGITRIDDATKLPRAYPRCGTVACVRDGTQRLRSSAGHPEPPMHNGGFAAARKRRVEERLAERRT
jgi:hypothetical protein